MNNTSNNQIRRFMNVIALAVLILSMCFGMNGVPSVQAQGAQPMILPSSQVESTLPPASIGTIGTSFDTATGLGITGPAYAPGQGIHGAGVLQNHYFQFPIRSTGLKTFRIVERGNIAQSIQLFDSSQTLIASGIEEIFMGFPQDREYLTYNFASTGLYYLRVNGWDTYLDYDLTWDYDGSSSSNALLLTGPDTEGFNDSRTDDWYHVNWGAGTHVMFSLNGASGSDFDLYVFDQSNLSVPIASSDWADNPEYVSITTQSSITYIRIIKFSEGGGYRLSQSLLAGPYEPTNLTVTAFTSSQIDLSWTDNSSDETNFLVERSLDGSTGWTAIGILPANTTSTSNMGLSACTTYYFRVRVPHSMYSNIASAKTTGCLPLAPSGLTATAISPSRINLSWTDNSSDEFDFRVGRSPDGSTGWTEIERVGANITNYSNTGLSACTTYYYQVSAYRMSDGAFSSFSNIASAKTNGCTSLLQIYLPLITR